MRRIDVMPTDPRRHAAVNVPPPHIDASGVDGDSSTSLGMT
jgi:hypothetical protein